MSGSAGERRRSAVERLAAACEAGQAGLVAALLQQGLASINQANSRGATPLTAAVRHKHTAVMQQLLQQPDIDVNKAEAVSGCTALHIACNDNNVVAVRALCGHPALRHNQTSHAGDTPLMLAVIQGHVEAVRELVSCDAVSLENLDYRDRLTFSNGNIVHNFLTILGVIDETKQRRLRNTLDHLILGSGGETVEQDTEQVELADESEPEEEEDDEDESGEEEGESVKDSIRPILHLVERVRADILTKMLDYDEKKASLEAMVGSQERETAQLAERQRRERRALDTKHARQAEQLARQQSEEHGRAECAAARTKQELGNLRKSLDHLLVSPGENKACTAPAPPCPVCPVCFDPLSPPTRILQCINGHLVCDRCGSQPQVETCPTCRKSITGRATAMEQHLRLLFPSES